MTTALNYLGRKFDVLALRGAKPRGDVRLTQTLFDEVVGGEVCTGVQKLAQRWALEFLTARGSMGFHLASRGTHFINQAKTGRLRTEVDVNAQFAFAAVLVRDNLIKEEDDTMHAEDRLSKATLLSIVLFGDSFQLYVKIESQAGDTREVILPIPITPVNIS